MACRRFVSRSTWDNKENLYRVPEVTGNYRKYHRILLLYADKLRLPPRRSALPGPPCWQIKMAV